MTERTEPSPCFPRRSRGRRATAFTLTELLVVISIIVLLLALAVPVFNIFRSGRSVDAAENIVSAMLQRTRARAIGLQDRRGLFSYTDPATGNVSMVIVKVFDAQISATNTNTKTYIEVDPDADEPQPLPAGVGIGFIVGFDTSINPATNAPYNRPFYKKTGLIVFDGYGRIEPLAAYTVDNAVGHSLVLYDQYLKFTAGSQLPVDQPAQYGLLLYEKQAFAAADPTGSDDLNYGAAQADWLNQNALALIVNRYNGTLFRGE
jgi:type II secretory pathway pseudopilin PulG